MRKLAVILACLALLGTLTAVTALPAAAQSSLCPGSLTPQLFTGARGQIAQSFSTLRDAPGGNPIQTVYAPAQFTVLSGPVSDGWLCYDQIQYDNGATGWAVESQVYSGWNDNSYWLTPVAAPPTPVVPPPIPPTPVNALCPGGLPNLLTVGGRGYVASTYSSLRDSPGGTPIMKVYSPAQFTVLAGPVSDGYLCYYQIIYDSGVSGWASESQLTSAWGDNMYWLAPLSAG